MMSDDPAEVDLVKLTPEQPAGVGSRQRLPLVLTAAALLVTALIGGYLYLGTPSREPTLSSNARSTGRSADQPREQSRFRFRRSTRP